MLQRVNAETQIPCCQFSASYVVLDKNSAVKLLDQVNKAGFASVGGVLAHGEDEGDGVFAWVPKATSRPKCHLRRVSGLVPDSSPHSSFLMTFAIAPRVTHG